MNLARAIPSMFHRRLILLFACCLGAGVVLAGQTARLTLVQGPRLRQEAESRLVRRSWIPTTRGRIYDRHGRLLAVDRPSYSLAVAYPVLTGAWAMGQALDQARASGADRWEVLTPEQRDALAAEWKRYFDRHVEAMWDELCEQTGTPRAVLDERIAGVIARVERMHERIVRARREKAILEMMDSGRDLDDRAMEDIERRINTPIVEMKQAHVLFPDVSDEVAFRCLRLIEQEVPIAANTGEERTTPRFPGLEVIDTTDRIYPMDSITVDVDASTLPQPIRSEQTRSLTIDGVASHVIGRTRSGPTREDEDARRKRIETDPAFAQRVLAADGTDRGRYFPRDTVGVGGIEGSQEAELRGLRGLRTIHLDSGEATQIDPVPGSDMTLTIDVMLQARIRAAMDPALGLAQVQAWHGNESLPVGTPLFGAAVVLDIDRAEVLALVSTPGIPREGFEVSPETQSFVAINAPYVNRAIAKPYPPGSIAKALVLCGAVKLGAHDLDHGIVCTGHLFADQPTLFRCWIYKHYNGLTHSPDGRPLMAPEALMRSCNIFFYTLGQRLGPQRIAQVYRWFGVGEAFNLGIGPEWPGKVGLMERTAGDGSDLQIQDAILMGIGQGPVTWTPLHAANAYATLARAGYSISPRLLATTNDELEVIDLGLPRRAVAEALEGLRLSVNDQNGTGHHLTYQVDGVNRREPIFNVPGVEVLGKTGTATAPDLWADPDGDGPMQRQIVRSGDHSWFVVLVGPAGENPRFAIAVVMDYAGSGGRVSGPIVNQIIWALRAEGYL
ncbi:MAG: hypothetical protein Kow0022_14100 [Phycisphaerales bacterium]